jgi:predicted ATPase
MPDEDVALLADLLSLPASQLDPLPDLSPQRKKTRILEALIRQLEFLARQQPVILVFEDAHWVDPTSLELLDLIVADVSELPVLLIITFRSQFQAPWTGQPHVTMLALNRFERRDRVTMVAQIAGKPLPEEVVDQIVNRSDGVPLFVEELTKSVLESNLLREENNRYVLDRALSTFAIPTSLHDSLMARLDRLAPVRRLAQIGAAIGREFSYELLAAVSRIPAYDLRAALVALVSSELVAQRGTPPNAVYFFKHALVQDAAHNSLLRGPRQQLHGQIADALEIQSPELMESQPELFAQHYAEAGLVEKSVTYWSRAGRRSVTRSAMAEAAAQFQKGLDQLTLMPDTPQRQRQELELCGALGSALQSVKGFAATETGRAYDRARELWELLGSPPEFIRIHYGQSDYYAKRGELELAHRLDDDLLRLSQQRNDRVGLFIGHIALARDLYAAGQLVSARSHLEAALALCDPASGRAPGGIHIGVLLHGHYGNVLIALGFLEKALAQINMAIAEARALAHAPSLAASLIISIHSHWFIRDLSTSAELSEEAIAIATEAGFPHWRAQATIFRGWVRFKNGDVTDGMGLLRSGLALISHTRADLRARPARDRAH